MACADGEQAHPEEEFAPDASSAPAWEDARRRAAEAMQKHPLFAAACKRPLIEGDPEHGLLDSLRNGEFQAASE